ncbi:MAG TPA: C25 family peptidase propeptide domain-containing protein, partial [Candidatus Eisenbacteria bacterium]|nr:C25 family peptidase propeptide domain-containing protein [Candidatus Eisenbacteria bacterium]
MRNVGFCLGVILLGALPQPSRADVGLTGLRVLSSDATSLTVEYDLPGYSLVPVQTPAGTLSRVRVQGLAATTAVGAPELPQAGAWVALPPVGSASLRVIDEEVERVPAVDVAPVYEPDFRPDASGALLPGRQFTRDPAAYARAGPYPEASAALEGEQWMRFQRVTSLRLSPIRYEALSRTLVVSKKIVVRIDFTRPPSLGLQTLARAGLEAGPLDDRSFEPVYGSAVLNYEVARAWRARPQRRVSVQSVTPSKPLDTGTGNPEWRVRVDTTGVWRVTFAQLAQQQWPAGIAIDQVVAFRRDTTANLEPVPWTMTEVPIDVIDVNGNAVFDAGDFIVLPVQNWADRAQPTWYERRYGDYEMIWLSYKSAGSGLRVPQAPSFLNAMSPAKPTFFPSFRHYEKNYHYFSFPLDVTTTDQFHWTDGNEDRTPADSIFADLLDLEPSGGSVHVRTQWIGHSNLDHLLSADWVRGSDNLATNLWTDTVAFNRFAFDAVKDFDAHLASPGLNRLRISGRVDAGPGGSQAGMNFFEVT